MPLTRNAAIAAISQTQFKLRWVPPAERESLRAGFIQCLNVESSSVTPEVNCCSCCKSDDDDGYNETASDVSEMLNMWTVVFTF